ncbi:MAG: nicotinate-nicotinamide nucleotide adenylyltransferase [Silvanigrellaceae bacterium]
MNSGTKPEKNRIGILGAAFDPPHFGHFLLAQMALHSGEIDEIWLVPSPERWDKSPVATGQQRLSWLQSALKECPPELKAHLQVSDIELQLPTYRGTHWLLTQLRRTHPASSFSLILGWDSFVGIPKWRDPTTGTLNGDELLKTTRLFVSPRPLHHDFKSEHPKSHPSGVVMLPALDDPAAGDIAWMDGIHRNEVAALSSSLVRTALSKQERIRFIFASVEKEIQESRIYDKS